MPTPQGFNIFQDIIQLLQDEGIDLPFQPTINFTGTGVTASDDPGNNRTNVDIPGGTTPHDLLDGVINQDTVANPATFGDLIIGNATPLWDVLSIGALGQVLTVVAGAPAWATPGSSFYQTIEDEGIALPQQPTFNFIGPIVTAVDDPGNNRTNITITGGAGGANTFILGYAEDQSLDNGGDEFASFFSNGTDSAEDDATGFLTFALTVKRLTVHVGTNSSSGITDIAMRDDGVDVPNTLINIPVSTTGDFDSGAISEAIVANSQINMRLRRNGSSTFGDYTLLVELEK